MNDCRVNVTRDESNVHIQKHFSAAPPLFQKAAVKMTQIFKGVFKVLKTKEMGETPLNTLIVLSVAFENSSGERAEHFSTWTKALRNGGEEHEHLRIQYRRPLTDGPASDSGS